MKFLLLLLLVVYVLWRWRAGQAARTAPPHQAQSVQPEPIAVVACAHCKVHIPLSHAVCVGAQYFCSAAHREAAGA